MFLQQTNLPPHQPTKIYLRLKDKKSFPLSLKESLTLDQLHEIILKKTKIPSHDLIVMHQGKQIHFSHGSELISLKDKSILHIINKKNLRNDIIEISVKFILRNEQKACLGETKLFAKCQESIKGFIHSKVVRVIQERTDEKICEDNLSLVLNGTVLKKHLNFHNYLIEDGSQVICMINNSESLQKVVNNVSTHKILVSHKEPQAESKRQSKSYRDPKSSPLQLSPHKRKSQVEKKTSLALSSQKSEQFVKLKTFESNNELAQKERLLNEAFQNQESSKKLKKKFKITSDLARKFQHECQEEHDYQNYKALDSEQKDEQNLLEGIPNTQLQSHSKDKKNEFNQNPETQKKDELPEIKTQGFKRPSLDFSNLENRNESNIWKEEPDSPIDVQYPPIERRGPSWVEWDPTTVSKSVGPRSEGFETIENGPEQVNTKKETFENKSRSLQEKSLEQKSESQLFSQNDLIFYGSFETEHKNRMDGFVDKFSNLIQQPKIESDNSAIEVEYPKIQKRGEPRLGDFLISGSLFSQPYNIINDDLINKFSETISKINMKTIQDYGLQQKEQKLQENLEADMKLEDNPETAQLQ